MRVKKKDIPSLFPLLEILMRCLTPPIVPDRSDDGNPTVRTGQRIDFIHSLDEHGCFSYCFIGFFFDSFVVLSP
jgi:hypothetical protein